MSTEELERRRELTDTAGLALVDAAPAGWRRIDLRCLATVDVHDFSLTVLLADGSNPAMDLPEETVRSVLLLREHMYRPGRGTWFSVRFMIDPPTKLTTSYNLDWDPGWEPAIAPVSWAHDLEKYPRDDVHVPDWLRAKLDEAATAGIPEGTR